MSGNPDKAPVEIETFNSQGKMCPACGSRDFNFSHISTKGYVNPPEHWRCTHCNYTKVKRANGSEE